MSEQRVVAQGRRAKDGAVGVVRVNIALTKKHHQLLKELAGAQGASAWIRNAIERATQK